MSSKSSSKLFQVKEIISHVKYDVEYGRILATHFETDVKKLEGARVEGYKVDPGSSALYHWGEAEQLSLYDLMKRRPKAVEQQPMTSWLTAMVTPEPTSSQWWQKVQEEAIAARWVFSLAIRKQNAILEHSAAWVQAALRAGGNPIPGGFQALAGQKPHWPAPALIIVWPWSGMGDPQGTSKQHYNTTNMSLSPQNT